MRRLLMLHTRFLTLAAIALLLLGGAPTPARAAEPDLAARLTAPGHVLMLRHALAPGFGDPANFRVDDCATQRNLDDSGRAQARAIGDWLRARGVQGATLYSSQWCRCLETARLLDLGPVTELPALNSFFELAATREPNLAALRGHLAGLPRDAGLVILVTHQVTISAIAGTGVASGEAVLLELQPDGGYAAVGRLRFDG
ncbi:MAG TPA: histidine phosphatase family protein [Gammaproteobacteria bacterium]